MSNTSYDQHDYISPSVPGRGWLFWFSLRLPVPAAGHAGVLCLLALHALMFMMCRLSSTSRIQGCGLLGIYLVLRVCILVSRLSRETQQV